MYGLLTFLALNSANTVFGETMAASLTELKPALSMVSRFAVETLTGRRCASAGSFWAVTTTVGSVTWGVPWGVGFWGADWPAGCANAATEAARTSEAA
jgi:hypothetical protein